MRALASAIPEIWMGHPKFKTCQGRFVVRRLGLATINLLTHYKDMKADEKCKNWGVLGV